MAAHRRHPATPNRVLILLLGIISVVAACGGNDADPTATTSPTRPSKQAHLARS
jgi:hypothetical protein